MVCFFSGEHIKCHRLAWQITDCPGGSWHTKTILETSRDRKLWRMVLLEFWFHTRFAKPLLHSFPCGPPKILPF